LGGRHWTESEVTKLRKMCSLGKTTKEMARELNRSYNSVHLKISREDISYNPTNQTTEATSPNENKSRVSFDRVVPRTIGNISVESELILVALYPNWELTATQLSRITGMSVNKISSHIANRLDDIIIRTKKPTPYNPYNQHYHYKRLF
jgi:predicted HTH transcriptional regulator